MKFTNRYRILSISVCLLILIYGYFTNQSWLLVAALMLGVMVNVVLSLYKK